MASILIDKWTGLVMVQFHLDESYLHSLHHVQYFNGLLFCVDATVDDLIDVIEGNRKYMKCIYVYNKIDVIGIDDVDHLARQPNSVVISCNLKLNFDRLLAKMWEEMGLVRVYTKPQGQQPDFSDPVVLSAVRPSKLPHKPDRVVIAVSSRQGIAVSSCRGEAVPRSGLVRDLGRCTQLLRTPAVRIYGEADYADYAADISAADMETDSIFFAASDMETDSIFSAVFTLPCKLCRG
ncbi:developmentally-regulated G-protein 2 isoform X3 [Fagus crenata]